MEVNEPVVGHDDDKAGARGTALDDDGHQHSNHNRSKDRANRHDAGCIGRTVEILDCGLEELKVLQRPVHEFHAQEEEAEADDYLAPVGDEAVLGQPQEQSRNDCGIDYHAYVEGDQLACHGGADVGAADDADGLLKVQQSGVDKAHDHDGGGRRRLDDAGNHRLRLPDPGAGQDRDIAVPGEEAQDGTHLCTCNFLKAVAHQRHAIYENRDATKNGKHVLNHECSENAGGKL